MFLTRIMNFGNTSKSIGRLLASIVLISSVVIGLSLSALEIRKTLHDQRQAFVAQSSDIINLILGGATNAAWAIDERLANEVISGLTRKEGIRSVQITASLNDGNEQILAEHQRDAWPASWLQKYVAREFFDDITHIDQILEVTMPENLQVGHLLINFEPAFVAQKFIAVAVTKLVVTLVQVGLIGLVLFIIAQWLITRPIQQASMVIQNIDPDLLDVVDYKLALPKLHKNNELGSLLLHTNQLLDRINTYQSRLRHLATKDSLTGLPNRMLIQDLVESALANARRNQSQVALLYIDLDRFKNVNDTLGHEYGDKLLKYVSLALLRQIRKQDTLGRLGGDEFLVCMPIQSLHDVSVMAERILKVLERTITIDGYDLRINASIGVSIYPDDGEDTSSLMRCADLAMYKAKENKPSHWHLFSEEMKSQLEEDISIENALAGAIANDQLDIHLQPKFRSADLAVAGGEALLRWNLNGQQIPPTKFIAVAEYSGQINELGNWVLNRTCQLLKSWGPDAAPISINVSGQQLADERFVNNVLRIVEQHDVDKSLIEFEITETVLMQNLEQSLERLNHLRDQGFTISIDDFGTGYSSLSYLTQLPIDVVKIDRSFVSGEQQSDIVLTAIIALGKALNISVVAEGVETEEQRSMLVEHGCDLLQGYLLGKPMPIEQYENLFVNQPALHASN